MKILVTGATGFLGRHLVERLHHDGFQIRCTVRDPRKAAHLIQYNDIEIVRGDLSNPQTALVGANGVDAIVHAAAHLGGWDKREGFIRYNLESTRNLLDAAVQYGVKRFVT